MTRAVAYVKDIVLGREGEVLKRACQTELIKQFAAANEIEIDAWFEDAACSEDILKRPGIQALLAYPKPFDLVICERPRALARSVAALAPFLQELDRRGVGLESATPAWDCLSQQCRRRSRSLPILPRSAQLPHTIGGHARYRVAKPARLNFADLVNHAPSSMSQRS